MDTQFLFWNPFLLEEKRAQQGDVTQKLCMPSFLIAIFLLFLRKESAAPTKITPMARGVFISKKSFQPPIISVKTCNNK